MVYGVASQAENGFTVPVRDLFPVFAECTYLDTPARSPLNVLGKQAAERSLQDRASGGNKPEMFRTVERVRASYASLIGAEREEIAFMKNITEGLNTIAHAIDWRPGDNVVLCPEIEHPANIYPWVHAAKLYGFQVRTITADNWIVRPEHVAAAIDENTRVCALSAVSFVPGFRTDLGAIGMICEKAGAALVVDAAQAGGIQDLDVRRLPIAAMAVSTQKGLLGLYGMGLLYVRNSFASQLVPRHIARFGVVVHGEHEADLGDLDDIEYADGALRFDVGNYNFLGAAAVEPGLRLLGLAGTAAIAAYTRELAEELGDRLHALGLPVVGWPKKEAISSIVCLGSANPTAAETAMLRSLDAHLLTAHIKFSERRTVLRFGFHCYNNRDDVLAVAESAAAWCRSR